MKYWKAAAALTAVSATVAAHEEPRAVEEYEVAHTLEAKGMNPAQLASDRDSKLKVWRDCLKKFADQGSIIKSDPTDLVVDIAMKACSSERRAGELAWSRNVFVASIYRPSAEKAVEMGHEAFAKFSASSRDDLLVRVSYNRQLQALDEEKERLRLRR